MTCIQLFLSLLWIPLITAQNDTYEVFTSTEPGTTPAVTVVDFVVEQLEAQTGLDLDNNVYTWDIPEIIRLVNESNPDFFYGFTQEMVFIFFPPMLIDQLPLAVKRFYLLCDYLPANDTVCMNATETPDSSGAEEFDVCVESLKPSKHRSPITETNMGNLTGSNIPLDVSGCGLKCSESNLIFGLSDGEQNALDGCIVVTSLFCLIALIYLMIHLVYEQKTHKGNYLNQSLLHQIPYIITFLAGIIVMCLMLGSGKNRQNITCNTDDNTATFYNPKYGKNGACVFMYIVMYGSIMLYFWYNALLSLVIFRTIYKPLKPMWKIEKKYFHFGVLSIVTLLVVSGLGMNSVDAVYPFGICFPGVASGTQIIVFVCLPFMLTSIITALCLVGARVTLLKVVKAKEQVVRGQQKELKELAIRLFWYCVCVLSTMLLLAATAIAFAVYVSPLRDSLEKLLYCQVVAYYMSGDINACQPHTTMPLFWFITWLIACFGAVAGQLALACSNNRRKELWKFMTKTHEIVSSPRTALSRSKDSQRSKGSGNKSKEGKNTSMASGTGATIEMPSVGGSTKTGSTQASHLHTGTGNASALGGSAYQRALSLSTEPSPGDIEISAETTPVPSSDGRDQLELTVPQ